MAKIDQFAAHFGLDWAVQKHDVCAQFKKWRTRIPCD